MANKRIIELQERTSIDMGDWLIVDSSTSTRKLSLATLFNYMTYSSMIFVTELPTTDISTTTIYLVPHSGSTTDWDEYIYRENEWVLIGTSTIDLSAIYQTKIDNNLHTTSKQIVGAINEMSDVEKIPDSEVTVPTGSDGYIINPFAVKCGNVVTLGCSVSSGTQSVPFAGRSITFPAKLKTTSDGAWYAVAGVGTNNDVEPAMLRGNELVLPPSSTLRNIAIYTITYVISPYTN